MAEIRRSLSFLELDESTLTESLSKQAENLNPTKTIPVSKLRKWRIFQNLDIDLLKNVKQAYVFASFKGELGSTAFIVTSNDDVYILGDNLDNGVYEDRRYRGENPPIEFSKDLFKLDELCQKSVVDIVWNGCFGCCAAITKTGELYTCGANRNGALGQGHNDFVPVPKLVEALVGKVVKQIALNGIWTLALLNDGQVYSFGYNGNGLLGHGNNEDSSIPKKIEALSAFKVKSVGITRFTSLALLDNGKLFTWGVNGNGLLGINNEDEKVMTNVPVEVTTAPEFKKVVCDHSHILGLSTAGEIYVWGINLNKKIGIGESVSTAWQPTKIKMEDVKVEDIAVPAYTLYNHFNSCRTVAGNYLVWGKTQELSYWEVLYPTKVSCKSFHEVFCDYSSEQELHAPISWDTFESDLAIRFEMALVHQDDNYYTDVVFVVEEKEIRTQKGFLQLNSEYFATMFANEWKETKDNVIKLGDEIRHNVFFALLFYLCSKDIILYEIEDLIDLLSLSNCYLLPMLQRDCEILLKKKVTIKNVVDVFTLASQSRLQTIKKFAFNFMSDNWKEITNTDLLLLFKLDKDIVVALMEKVAALPEVSSLEKAPQTS